MKNLQYRVAEVLEQQPATSAPQRIRTVTEPIAKAFSRRVIMRAHAENMASVLQAAIKEFYRETPDGKLWNVQEHGRIQPVPWGRTGYRAWGVRRMYAECLRSALLAEQNEDALFIWLPDRRGWHINLERYQTEQAALVWLDRFDLQPQRVMEMVDEWTDSRQRSRRGRHG